jgi:alkylation response protein AidB-like acyl-CoA dehydrogenase
MRFDLTDEQKELSRSIERTLEGLVDLARMAGDDGAAATLAAPVDAALAGLGLTAAMAPEAHGGLGMGLLTLVAAAQVLGRCAAPGQVLETALAAWAIAEFGSNEQRARWLPGLIAGETPATFALNEAQGAWTPDAWRAGAADGEIAKRDVRPLQGPGLILVGTAGGLMAAEAQPNAFVRPAAPLDLTRPLARIALPATALEPLTDRAGAWRVYEALLVLAAADAAGAGQRALEMTVDYAKTREQFGQPIGAFQGLKHQLAEMAVDIAPAHFPCWFAAHAFDLGQDARRTILLAKAHATDMAVKTARAAVEAHGGIAYTWDYPLHLLLKRAMQDRATLSSPSELRRMVGDIDDAR